MKLLTIHASKGLEFDTVFVVGCEEDLLPHYHATRGDDGEGEAESEGVDEERRLLYVAMTRARRRLYLCWAHQRLIWGTQKGADRSRFLDELCGSGLVETL